MWDREKPLRIHQLPAVANSRLLGLLWKFITVWWFFSLPQSCSGYRKKLVAECQNDLGGQKDFQTQKVELFINHFLG